MIEINNGGESSIAPVPSSSCKDNDAQQQATEEEADLGLKLLDQFGFVGLLAKDKYNLPLYKQFFHDLETKHGTSPPNENLKKDEPKLSRDGRVLSQDYYKSVYNVDTSKDKNNSNSKIPWKLEGGRPQPEIKRAYEEGKLRGRIIDAGCGEGENSLFLASKHGVTSVVGFDIADGAIAAAQNRASRMGTDAAVSPFWTPPAFLVASCTEIDSHSSPFLTAANDEDLFDVSIDSGLLHCLSDDDARKYVVQLGTVVKRNTGRAFVGCFSTANPDPWDNPRRLSEEYLRKLFCATNGWEVVDVRDTWWSRPPHRGSSQGSFSMALWMEARRL